jgi:hypothetical protein
MVLKNVFSLISLILTSILLFAPITGKSQNLLEKRISIRVTNLPVDDVLKKIENLGNFSFSYSPDAVDVKRSISLQANNQSIREILNEIFRGSVSYKERRKYIILQNSPPEKENSVPENFNLNGYIIDEKTGEKLANASIYESATLVSTISNQFGYYKIRLPTSKTSLRLEVRKEAYIARSIPVSNRKDTYFQIGMNPDTIKPITSISPKLPQRSDSLHQLVTIPQYKYTPADSLLIEETRISDARRYENIRKAYLSLQSEMQNAFASARQAINIKNISDTLYRPLQASILPFLGTNRHLSGNVVNDISLNFFAGYSLGVRSFELGAFLNVVRGNVTGFQLAGVSNVVGNDVTGFQYANMLNLTLGNVTGFQGSQLLNYTGQNFRGFQLAGVGNVIVGSLNGYQLSAVYNYAHTVETGHQIGLVNYANYSETVPFGIFSYVRKNGYRRYEFGSNEFDYFSFSFKTGVSRFYNIFSLGFNGLSNNKSLGTLGYGFGTALKLGQSWMMNADLTANAVVMKDQNIDEIPAGLFRFSTSIEKKFGQRFAIFAGPSINMLAGNYTGLINTKKNDFIKPIWLGEKPGIHSKNYGWIGFQAGIRFCNRI